MARKTEAEKRQERDAALAYRASTLAEHLKRVDGMVFEFPNELKGAGPFRTRLAQLLDELVDKHGASRP